MYFNTLLENYGAHKLETFQTKVMHSTQKNPKNKQPPKTFFLKKGKAKINPKEKGIPLLKNIS